MTSNAAELELRLIARDEASKVFRDVKNEAEGFGKTLGDIGKIAGGFLAANVIGAGFSALKNGISSSIDLASDFNESLSKVQVVFGDTAGEIEAFASTAAKSLGMSSGAALEATGTFGNFLQAMGLAKAPAADMSKAMVTLAADLASFNNANPEEVLLALRSGLSGEAEPMRKFGVALSETAVKAKAAEMGLKGVGGELTEQQKIQARYAIIMEQTTMAQGDFARTAEGAANKSRIQAAALQDLQVKFGQVLLPIKLFITDGLIRLIEIAGPLANMLGSVLAPAFASVKAAITPVVDTIKFAIDNLKAIDQGFLEVDESMAGWQKTIIAITQEVNNFFQTLKSGTTSDETATWAESIALAIRVMWEQQVKPAITAFIDIVRTVAGAVRDNWSTIGPIVEFVANYVKAQIEGMIQVFQGVVQVVSGVVQLVAAVLHGDWAAAWEAMKQIAEGVLNIFIGNLKRVFGSIPEIIYDFAATAASAALEFGKGIADGIAEGIKSGINWVISAVNSVLDFIRSIRIEIPRIDIDDPTGLTGGVHIGGGSISIPGVPGNITPLAKGTNYVPQNMLAMLHKGEAVVPADYNQSPNVTINVHGSILSERELIGVIKDALQGGALRGYLRTA